MNPVNLRESFQEQHCFSKVALANFGFEFCLRSKLLRELYSIKPTGSRSCLFDAIVAGLELMRGLYQMIEESGRASSWKLINVIIVDGKDNCSKNSWAQVKQAYREAKARIRAYEFKTVVIAYNVTPQVYSELLFLAELDMAIPIFPASYYHNEYDELNLGKLMKKIRRDAGLIFKQPRQSDLFHKKDEEDVVEEGNPYDITETKFSYAVLFTISGSREYDDEIWNSICNNINNFTRYLGDRDVLGGIIYSDAVRYFKEDRFIIKEEKKKLVSPPPPPQAPVPPPQYVYNPNSNPPAYVPPPYVYYPPPPPPAPPAPRVNPVPPRPPPQQKKSVGGNARPSPINKSTNSKRSQSQRALVGNSEINQSRAYTMCEAGSKCRSFCACFITIFAIVIIAGVIYMVTI